jgi:hypothetical protein
MTEQQESTVNALRPLLTQALHVVQPNVSLVECAQLANAALDDIVVDGDTRFVSLLLAVLEYRVAMSDNAEAEQAAST